MPVLRHGYGRLGLAHKPTAKTSVLVLSALGVVFGGISTSHLYTLRVCFSDKLGLAPTPENVLGLLSLIFWALVLTISFKYALFILRADDHGQGVILTMLAMLHKQERLRIGQRLTLLTLFDSALLYGDGLITLVISVLSALEALEVATTAAKPLSPAQCSPVSFWYRPTIPSASAGFSDPSSCCGSWP